ncbi:MAG: DUF86 domain-containing protein [Gemmatimonadota bacterium]|nr:DUF86 domain-containing protein [Gemmatimonadota bacterium]
MKGRSVVEAATVDRLLETIERRLTRLDEASSVSLEEYRTDSDLRDIVERNFELAIQAAIDLGLHLLADLPHPLPRTNRAVFEALAQEGVLDESLVDDLSRWPVFGTSSLTSMRRFCPSSCTRTSVDWTTSASMWPASSRTFDRARPADEEGMGLIRENPQFD